MLGVAGMIVALDAFGPVTDNAGGIAEMAGLPAEVRHSTECAGCGGQHHQGRDQGLRHRPRLAWAPLCCSPPIRRTCSISRPTRRIIRSSPIWVRSPLDLTNPYVVVGLLFGGLLPFLFGGMSMMAVGRAAESVVAEVRRQFRENPGIMTYQVKPEYGRAGRHPDQGGDSRNDRAVAAAGPVAHRPVCRGAGHFGQGQRLRRAGRHADGG